MISHCSSLLSIASALAVSGFSIAESQPTTDRGALPPGVTAVTHVAVIPMRDDVVQLDATVIVRDGRIAAVGPAATIAVPRGARVIDGRGKYLIPGLADMHVHLLSDGEEVHDSAGAAEVGVMLANGVTAARLMIGTPEHLALRRDVAQGRVVGPQLWVASPQLAGRASENTFVVTTPNEARDAVRRAVDGGYDFVKITLFITPEVYDAIIDEAKARGIRAVGHVDPQVGVRRALAANAQIEHLDSYLEAVLADSAPTRTALTQMLVFAPRNWASMDYIGDRRGDGASRGVRRTHAECVQYGVWSRRKRFGHSKPAGLGVLAAEDAAGLPQRAQELLGLDDSRRANSRTTATLRRSAQQAREGDPRLGRADRHGIGYARVVSHVRLGAAS
ncbi:MAG: amidohydrolase family protein [Gemmatimonadaceae bacterium]